MQSHCDVNAFALPSPFCAIQRAPRLRHRLVEQTHDGGLLGRFRRQYSTCCASVSVMSYHGALLPTKT